MRPLEPQVQDDSQYGICGGLSFCPPTPFQLPTANLKAKIRREMRQRRALLSDQEQKQSGTLLARFFASSKLKIRAPKIGLFIPHRGEINVLALLKHCRQPFVPALPALRSGRLQFHGLLFPGEWRRNRYGIPEYIGRRSCPIQHLDVLVLPLVACDLAGRRLGMGGGYYDRALAYLRHRRYWRRPMLIGAAYYWQLVEQLPADAWDIPLDALLTDQGWVTFTARAHHIPSARNRFAATHAPC